MTEGRENNMAGIKSFHIVRLRRKDLEKLRETGQKRDIEVVGMVYADEDVDPELVKQTISSTKIYGGILGRSDTRTALLDMSAI